LTFRPTVLDQDILALDETGLMQTLSECGQPLGLLVSECDAEKSNYWHHRLRARRERPHHRAAEQRMKTRRFSYLYRATI
jgi:hypothetical protein